MPSPFKIVSIGDSVIWGQGLLEAEKLDWLVQQALTSKYAGGATLERLAHSGAVIGAAGVTGIVRVGEVPTARLSIIEQCSAVGDSPASVDLVIVNGGINDIGVETILNPLALIPGLDVRIERACHDGMCTLLEKVAATFSKPTCRIVLLGYYPILSPISDPLGIAKLLSLHGIAVPSFVDQDLDFMNLVVQRCESFFADSTMQLQRAVADVGDARIVFVSSGFTDANAVYASGTSLLWSLDLTDDMDPLDPVAALRRPLCDAAYPGPLEGMHRELCYRASAGHPNVAGAALLSEQILAALLKA